jgi:hypothetical protein
VQRQDDVPGQPDRVAVGLVEGEPGELAVVGGRPLAERRGLAVSGGRGEQHERDVRGNGGEPRQQAGSQDQAVPVERLANVGLRRGECRVGEFGPRHGSVLLPQKGRWYSGVWGQSRYGTVTIDYA